MTTAKTPPVIKPAALFSIHAPAVIAATPPRNTKVDTHSVTDTPIGADVRKPTGTD
jgi:hypothetical protein